MASYQIDLPASTVSIPPGAATSANQLLEIADLDAIKTSAASIDTKATSLSTSAKQDLLLTAIGLLAKSTDTQPVSVSGSVSVTGPLTDAQLRALAVPVSVSGVATAANQATEIASLSSIDTKLTSQATATKQDTGNTSLASIDTKLTSQATAANQTTGNTSLGNLDINLGAKADAVATTDTGTFSLIALTKKIAQNISAMSAKLPAALGTTTSANSLSVAPASDAIFNVKPKALTNSYDELPSLTTAATFTAPANAIGGKIYAKDSNGANIRWKMGATASATSGLQLQPGRSEDFNGGSSISVISESGTNEVAVIWTIQA